MQDINSKSVFWVEELARWEFGDIEGKSAAFSQNGESVAIGDSNGGYSYSGKEMVNY